VKKVWASRFIATVCVVLLAACASTPQATGGVSNPDIELSVLMDQAAATEKTGQTEVALREYGEASRLYPTSKLPWLRIAQIQFESNSYGDAITAAQQVVSRDDRDKIANSILAVSGLRVSSKALADLRIQNELTGSIRDEAQDLAKVLRESLGERNLVPAAPATAVSPTPRPAKGLARKRAVPKTTKTSVAPLRAASGESGSPFGALK
jgi:hypothetical protein